MFNDFLEGLPCPPLAWPHDTVIELAYTFLSVGHWTYSLDYDFDTKFISNICRAWNESKKGGPHTICQIFKSYISS